MNKRTKIALICLLVVPPASLTLLSLCSLLMYISKPYSWIFFILGMGVLGTLGIAAILYRRPVRKPVPFHSGWENPADEPA